MNNRIFYIAGAKHHQAESVKDNLKEGIDLVLVLESENKFNSNAIAIYYQDDATLEKTKLGYVPDKIANEIAEENAEYGIDEYAAFLIANDQSKPTYERYRILLINVW